VALALGVVAHPATSIALGLRFVLICVGKARSPFADDVAHYERLLGRHARLETIELPEAGARSARDAPAARASEAEAILRRAPPDAWLCALDRGGRALSSKELAGLVAKRRNAGRDVCFAIGGPFGLDPSVLERASERLSLGPITLPHQLARVVFLEQLYRAHKIVLGEPYHY
jgi:23S rRNA (pseudouridine1915-N3)-methyltransferase